jgi:hypothetical protein
VRLRVRDLAQGDRVVARASVVQQKTGLPVRFEITEQTREALTAWIAAAKLSSAAYLFPSRQRASPHLSTRQYARIVKRWIAVVGGDPRAYGTHSLRRTKATLIYRRTKHLGVFGPNRRKYAVGVEAKSTRISGSQIWPRRWGISSLRATDCGGAAVIRPDRRV